MMRILYSLRTRIIILYSALLLLGFVGLAFWAGQQIETAAQEDFEHRAESEVAIVARALADPVEHYLEGELNLDEVAQTLENLSQQTNSDLVLVNNQGQSWLTTLLANDAAVEPVTPTSYLNLPEIITARDNRITHETRPDNTGEETIFTAAPIIDDGRLISVVQLAIPLGDMQSSIQDRWATLGLGVAALAALVILVSVILSTSLTRPLGQMQRAAVQIGEGNFSVQLPDQRRDEIGQVAQTFNAMRARIQGMLEEQRAFASNASHELRTPLTTIGLRIEALLEGEIPPEKQARYLREVDAEIQRMRNLVDDLIMLSHFDAGSAEIGRDRVDLQRLARQLIAEVKPQAQQQHIDVVLDVSETLPTMHANLTHLHVVFRNVLDNAIKYMSDEGGTIRWEITVHDAVVISTITDTGKGIAANELANVGQRFYRAAGTGSPAVPGAGLGLSLVQSIINAYHGSFSLESPGIGQGTTVTIHWPIAPSA